MDNMYPSGKEERHEVSTGVLACLYLNEVLKSLILPPAPRLKPGASVSGDTHTIESLVSDQV